MKKLILILAIALIASPSYGALTVTLSRTAGTNVVDVNYSGAGTTSTTRPRAFALDLTFSGTTATFASFAGGSYKQGESTTANRGYGIYPARINITTAGSVTNWGTPDANANDPGPGTGLGTNHLVLEFGSLYYGEVNAPATSGKLCSLVINPGSESNPVITMIDEVTYRGGVVYENGSQDLTAADKTFIYTTLTPPGPAGIVSPANGAVGINSVTGTTLTWTAGSGTVDSHDVYFGTANPPAFKINQTGVTNATGAMVQGKVYYWRIDEKNSAGTTTGTVWSFNTDCMKSTAAEYTNWTTTNVVKKVNCWCYEWQKMGDLDGKEQDSGLNKKRIGTVDLGIFKANYGKKRANLTTELMLSADIDHLDQDSGLNKKAVGTVDLAIFKANYGKKTTGLPNPPSYAGDYYYWTVAP